MGCTSSQEKQQRLPAKEKKKKVKNEEMLVSSPPVAGEEPMHYRKIGGERKASSHARPGPTSACLVSSHIHDYDMTTQTFEKFTKPPENWKEWSTELTKGYDLRYEIGKGDYGSVWRAAELKPGSGSESRQNSQGQNHHHVAVKVMNRSEMDAAHWELSHSEVDLLKSLTHPNVLAVVEVIKTPDAIFLVTELCKGGELLCSISEHVKIYAETVSARMIANILSGLVYLHEKGIWHRDIKPANMLLRKRLKHDAYVNLEHKRHRLEDTHSPSFMSQDDPAFRSIGLDRHGSVAVLEEMKAELEQKSTGHASPMGATQSIGHSPAAPISPVQPARQQMQPQGHHEKTSTAVGCLQKGLISEKSRHIVCSMSSEVVIADFGQAFDCKGEPRATTVEGLSCSELFTAPEVLALMVKNDIFRNLPSSDDLKNLPEIDKYSHYNEKCDIWSLGVVSYILLGGYHPNIDEIQQSDHCMSSLISSTIAFTRPSFEGKEWKKVSNDAKDFVRRCLVAEPEKRESAKSLLKHPWFTSIKTKLLGDTNVRKSLVKEAALAALR